MSLAKAIIPAAVGLLTVFCVAFDDPRDSHSDRAGGTVRPMAESDLRERPQSGGHPEESLPVVLPDNQWPVELDRLRSLRFPPEKIHYLSWEYERKRWITKTTEPFLWIPRNGGYVYSEIDGACVPLELPGGEPTINLRTPTIEPPINWFPADVIHDEYWEDIRDRHISSVQLQNDQGPPGIESE